MFVEGKGKVEKLVYTPMELGEADAPFMPKVIDEATGKTEANGVMLLVMPLTGSWSIIGAVATGRKSAEVIDFALGGTGQVMEENCAPDTTISTCLKMVK